MDKLTFQTNYEVVEPGFFGAMLVDTFGVTTDVRPVPDSVVLTRSQLTEMLGKVYDAGNTLSCANKEDYVKQIIDSLKQ